MFWEVFWIHQGKYSCEKNVLQKSRAKKHIPKTFLFVLESVAFAHQSVTCFHVSGKG